jgi:hypothetical protein
LNVVEDRRMGAAARRAGPLLATIVALSACAPTPANPGPALPPVTARPTPSATTSAATSCPPPGVVITAGLVDAALGLRAMGIDLLNCGTEPYTVQGYPAVRVLDDDRQPLDVAVLDGTAAISSSPIVRYDGPPQRVTAAPGERITAVVVWRNTVADTSIPAATGRYLEIAPAEGQPAQTVTPGGGIDLGTTGRLAVSAWITPPTG